MYDQLSDYQLLKTQLDGVSDDGVEPVPQIVIRVVTS